KSNQEERTGMESKPERSSKTLAYSNSIGNHSEGRNQNNTNGEKKNEKRREPQFGPGDDCKTMAHTSCTRREECDDAAITDQAGHGARGGDAGDATLAYSYSGEGDERRRSAQEDVRGCCSTGRNVGRREKSDALYNLRRSTQP